MPAKFPRFRGGEQFGIRGRNGELILDAKAANFLNAAIAEMQRLGKVSAVPPMRWSEGADGRRVSCDVVPEIWVKLSGAGPQYSFVQQQYNPGTNTWTDMDGGRTGDECYESKGKTGLSGKVVRITYVPSANDWRFSYIGLGVETCLWTFITNDLCSGVKLPGSLVTLSQGGIEIVSCTTVGQVASVTRVLSGANYTSVPTVTISGDGSGATAVAVMQIGSLVRSSGGTGYNDGTFTGTLDGAGGSGGTFSFTVSGGVVQSTITILARGSGYTGLPTPDFSTAGPGSGAALTVRLNVLSLTLTAGGSGYSTASVGFSGGGGSGASGTATVAAQCTLDVPAGDYDIEVTPPEDSPYAVYTDTLSHTCGQTTTISLDVNEDNFCSSGCGPCLIYPKVIHVTWTVPPSIPAYALPDDTFTLGAALPGQLYTWYGTVEFPEPDADPPQTLVLTMGCQGTAPFQFGISARRLPGYTIPSVGLGGTLVGATVTCSPFTVIEALGTFDSQWSADG